jgi:alpha-tubulin suppressor-like RCC1 family protein
MNFTFAYSGLSEHCLFVSTSGVNHTWGSPSYGALGVPSLSNDSIDGTITSLSSPIKHAACGEHHSLVLLEDGSLYTWGAGSNGQLGLGSTSDVDTPSLLPFPKSPSGEDQEVVLVKTGANFSVALTKQGKIYVWGESEVLSSKTPAFLSCPEPIVDLACGWGHLLGLTRTGTVYAWGLSEDDGGKGRTGGWAILELPQIKFVAAGNNFSLFITHTGTLLLVGGNTYVTNVYNQKDFKVTKKTPIKIPIPENLKVSAVIGGGNHVLALLEDGRVVGWGWNIYGQIGVGNTEPSGQPLCFIWPEMERVDPPKEGEGEGEEKRERGSRKKVTGKHLEIAGLGCGWGFSWLITRDGSLHLWGSTGRGAFVNPETNEEYCRPQKVGWLELVLPPPLTHEEWERVFSWVFLGRLHEDSEFSRIPVEVVFNMVKMLY